LTVKLMLSVRGVAERVVDQSSVGDVLLGEGGARHQPGAAEAEVAFRIRTAVSV
jgi:hypothetical protein